MKADPLTMQLYNLNLKYLVETNHTHIYSVQLKVQNP